MKHLHIFFIFLLLLIPSIFFKDFFLQGKLPIPADTIVGLYHPFRDIYASDYPNGIPYKNSLITDPVRQQYPWRKLSFESLKTLQLPLWNPYSMTGAPLLGNLQSAPLYPLNFILFILPFETGWTMMIFLQIVLAGVFLYCYLSCLKLDKRAAFLGAFVFAFSGFSIAWLEWNTILQTALWLPLILLCIEKILLYSRQKTSIMQFRERNIAIWYILFVFSLISSFFAGHLQTFFYSFIVLVTYFFTRWVQMERNKVVFTIFISNILLFTILTAVQWIPTLQMILNSARAIDQADWQKEGWFVPWQNMIQFIAPDFFGNPTTLNYWGIWNYAEFVGYIGLLPLVLGLYALFFRKDKKTFFFGTLFFLSLIFALPTFFAKLPYILNIPFLSTSQPTRLLFITDFSLAILSALGLDYFFREKKRIYYPLVFVGSILLLLWSVATIPSANIFNITSENILVIKRNLLLPSVLFFAGLILFTSYLLLKNKAISSVVIVILLLISILDLVRFADKFTPFVEKKYLFPDTKSLQFLQSQKGYPRIMSTDSRILPPNFSLMYKLQSVDGYDPLYLQRYGELIATSESDSEKLPTTLGFNRIVTPQNYNSRVIDLMGTKYVLSLSDIADTKLKKVFQEGETRIYENIQALPRTFFVSEVIRIDEGNKQGALKILFDPSFDMSKSAIVEKAEGLTNAFSVGTAEIASYTHNKVIIKTSNREAGFLVFTDAFYPSWHVKIYNKEKKVVAMPEIYRTDYHFRGIEVPAGEHSVEFYTKLF